MFWSQRPRKIGTSLFPYLLGDSVTAQHSEVENSK